MIRVAAIMGKMSSGGKKSLVMEYYRHINREEIQFDFLCDADSNSIPFDEIERLGGRVYLIPPYQKIFANMAEIRRICRENRYPIMHGYNSTMNVFCMLAGKQAGVPIRINESISMGHRDDKKNILKNLLKPFSKCFSTHYMANGEACGIWQFGEKTYKDGKVKVFKTIIDVEQNQFDPELRRETRQAYGIEDNLVIGHIARLTTQKNTLFLIDIFAEIVKIAPHARLLLIGDGDLREAMLRRIDEYGIKDKVIYLGRREDIPQFYNAMDCFLLPSLYEGLPVVGVEAECCGLPVFFSTEIPEESTACKDLGFFLDLSQGAQQWARCIVEKTNALKETRRDRSEDVKKAGFDSKSEGIALAQYYLDLLKKESHKS